MPDLPPFMFGPPPGDPPPINPPPLPKRYGVFDERGAAQGFWCDDIFPPNADGSLNPKIPAEAVLISEDVYQELLKHQFNARYQGGKVVLYGPTVQMDSYTSDWGPTMTQTLGGY